MRGARPLLAGVTAVVVGVWLQRFVWADAELVRGTSDLRNYFFPLYELTYGWIAQGEIPLWNPFHLAGYPQLATLQGGFFYPPHALYLLLPTPHALAASHVLHLVWIAATTVWLARRVGVGALAAGLAAIVFTLRGTVQWWLLWPAMLESASWLPLGCIAVIDLARGGGARSVALLALCSAMTLLAGHAQVTGYLAWTWGTLLVALLLAERGGLRGSGFAGLRFVAALAIGAAVAAIQIAPVAELSLDGTRRIGALPPSQVLAMGAGGFRSLADLVFASQFSVGAVALVLAPAALLVRRHRVIALWAWLLVIASTLLAGATSDAAIEVYRSIPGIGWFRSPRRILLLTHFGTALLSGLGLQALIECARGARPESTATAGAPALIGLLALGLAVALGIGGAVASAVVAAAVCAATAVCVWVPRAGAARVAAAAIASLAFVELFLANTAIGRLPYTRADAAVYRTHEAAYRALAATLGADRVVSLPLPRSRDLKLAGIFGLRRLDDFEPLNLRRQSEFFTYFQHGRSHVEAAKRFFAGEVFPERRWPAAKLRTASREMASRRRLLDLAATRVFVTPDGLGPVQRQSAREFVAAAGLEPAAPIEGFTVATNPNALPRAFVTYGTLPAPAPDELLGLISREAFDPLEWSYVEGAGEPARDRSEGAPIRGVPARITVDEPTRVEVDADLAAPGLVVLADAYYSGWHATLDGEKAPILATNHLFRGVRAPAGRHRVRFEYRPPSLWVGAAVSVLGLVALAAVWRAGHSTRIDTRCSNT